MCQRRTLGPADTPSPRAARGRAGYTLMELMTVLVVLGILGTVALPRLDLSQYRSDAALHSMGAIMLGAQRAAVMKQRQEVVAFDVAGRRVRVHDDLDNDGRVDAGEHLVWYPLETGVVFGRDGAPAHSIGPGPITFTRQQDGMPSVTFLRNGAAEQEGGVYLTTLRARQAGNRPRDARLVIVARATGRPSWLSYQSGSWKTEF
jgi:prepilin-type N-terminal cleavage/methylation domain-containing protein